MGKETAIAWTHHTFNPWWGCSKIAPECAHCYAETFAKRTGHKVFGPGAPRRFFGDKHWAEPLKWDRDAAAAGERRRVFCASMADVFDTEVDESWRMKLWGLIEATPHLDWLLLTKRPQAAGWCIPAAWSIIRDRIWLGTSAGTQATAAANVPPLLTLDAAVHFVSAEPLLERVEFGVLDGIDWVIVGGESGPRARPCAEEWIRDVVGQCRGAGVPVFVKQDSGPKAGQQGRIPDDLWVKEFPHAT